MSISVNIHPESFGAQKSDRGGNCWLNIATRDSAWATVHVSTPEQADELIRAAVELKRLIVGDTISITVPAKDGAR